MAKRTERIVILLTPEERDTLRETAGARGATVGGFARKAALDQAARDENRERLVREAEAYLRAQGVDWRKL
jgi:uncharacterized protein (DUF1778 family)